MSIEKMVAEGKIHPFRATPEEVEKAMSIARRDLAMAETILHESLDWSYSIAYNAVLQACRAYMYHLGYRPAAAEAHKSTFEFMQEMSEKPIQDTVAYFDRVRKKRHKIVYNEVGLATRKETEQLIKKAREFIEFVDGKIRNSS